MQQARRFSASEKNRLREMLRDCDPSDTSIVVFGSLARGEYTAGSDLDWTLLVDGQADAQHYGAAQQIANLLLKKGFPEPGPTGVFGNIAFSHPIVHQIGGQEDTNRNITQRILLLLESFAVGKQPAYERVLQLVLERYVEDDGGLRRPASSRRIPLFLLNDIVRYWRTLTVDFVYKQRERTSGYALRNVKLRMSRKLTFAAGLLTCFSCQLEAPDDVRNCMARSSPTSAPLVRYFREKFRLPPLDLLAQTLLRYEIPAETARLLFDAYDEFLALVSDTDKRLHLKELRFEDIDLDLLFTEARKIGRRFQQGLTNLFYRDHEDFSKLIEYYGVF